jgi:hypothetical protein
VCPGVCKTFVDTLPILNEFPSYIYKTSNEFIDLFDFYPINIGTPNCVCPAKKSA